MENNIQTCECCGQKISKKRRRVEKSMITALLKATNYCIHSRQRTFKKRDVTKMTPVEYTLITYLVKFGLLYKDATMKPGEFGIPFTRVKKFFSWEWSVAEYFETDPLLKEGDNGYRVMSENRLYVHEIPKHSQIVKDFPSTLEYLKNSTFENHDKSI